MNIKTNIKIVFYAILIWLIITIILYILRSDCGDSSIQEVAISGGAAMITSIPNKVSTFIKYPIIEGSISFSVMLITYYLKKVIDFKFKKKEKELDKEIKEEDDDHIKENI